MKRFRISRRTMLRGTGTSLALPLLEVMSPVSARETAHRSQPTRFACLYLPNGSPPHAWTPSSKGGRLLTLTNEMTPLLPFLNDIQIISGLQSELKGSHPAAGATWLIRPAPEGDEIDIETGVGGMSMDQIIARVVGKETRLPSLEMITRAQGSFSKSLMRNHISWKSSTPPLPRETEPRAIFDRLTRSATSNTMTTNPNDRNRILDTVIEDARSLRNRISFSDRSRLDEYLDAVRTVEKQITRTQKNLPGHTDHRFASAVVPDAGIPFRHQEYLRLMFDMIVLAFWTDSTRVATFMLDHEQSNRYFNFLPGVKGMWHALSHWKDISGKTEDDDGKTSWNTKEVKLRQYLKVITFHHEQVAYFLDRLRNITEADGSLLDHSMILYGSPFADGHQHASRQLPVMIAGKAGGKLNAGRHLSYPEAPLEGLYLSLMDVMGVQMNRFGGTDKALAI